MALTIVWTKRAEIGYDNIIAYLEEQWTEKEIKTFVIESRDFFKLLSKHPNILKQTNNRKNIHRGPMNELTMLTYRIKPRKKEIQLINIRSTRKKPLK